VPADRNRIVPGVRSDARALLIDPKMAAFGDAKPSGTSSQMIYSQFRHKHHVDLDRLEIDAFAILA
jgi:hypothetical protein